MAQINRTQLFFWIAAACVAVLGILFLHEVLLPFVLGLVLAYFLDPVADMLVKAGLPRLMATIIITLFFGLTVILALVFLIPLVVNQLTGFAEHLPGYIQILRDYLDKSWGEWFRQTFPAMAAALDASIKEMAIPGKDWLGKIFNSLLTGSQAVFNFFSLILLTPVVTFYLLDDWPGLVERVDSWLPRDHAPTIRLLARRIDNMMAGFIRGQVLVCFLLGTFYAVGLSLAGLQFGVIIGIFAGILSFVPFLGSITGLAVSAGVAIAQFWPDWTPIAVVIGVFIAGQLIEGNVLTPKIIGDKVRLHPVWLIFALFVFGYLFGFVGMLLAVPIAAAIGVLVRFGLEKYLESPVYMGTQGAEVEKTEDAAASQKPRV